MTMERHLGIALACLSAGLGACAGEIQPIREIEVSREVDLAGDGIQWNATSAERFGLASMGQAPPPPPTGAEPTLTWDAPSDWQEVAPTQFRAVNFQVPGDPPVECYLTVLRGDAGGLAANANRWRQQMSREPVPDNELQALPRLPFFGGDATFLDLEGTFTGMGGDQNGADYRLLGLLLIDPEGSRFLKMIGPKAAVTAQTQNFRNLAASFRLSVDEPAAAAAAAPDDEISFVAPDHWRPMPPQPMRQVNFRIGPALEVDCYVTILPGTGGGAQANFDRWCSQMGRTPLTQAEFEGLERFEMLGGSAAMAELQGSFDGGAGTVEDALMLGIAGSSSRGAAFVKMVGPRDLVEAEREAFLAFAKSLRMDG